MAENRTIVVQDKTFEVIRTAVNKMVDLIRPTFGPAGNKVIISKMLWKMVVDDGVQIARDFELEDPAENAVVSIVREAAIKTNDRVGDGTTGSLLILQAIINEAARLSRRDGRRIVDELYLGLQEIKEQLQGMKREVVAKEDLKKVALIAFDNESVAELVASLYEKVGKDGIITISRSPTMETYVEVSDGVKIERGYISPYMVNNAERMECVLEKPYILLTDYRLTEANDLFPIINQMAAAKKTGLVVIAENVEQHALATMVINLPQVMNPETRKLGTFPSVALNLPKVDDRDIFLEDMAILTGAKVFSASKGDKLESAKLEDLGRCNQFIARREESIIIGPRGDKNSIEKCVSELRLAGLIEPDERRKKDILYRFNRFTNTIATIKVGAPTDNEQKALKYKVEDTVNAVKAAFRGGVVCGAGNALASVKTSSPILREALKYPRRQLFENMGIEPPELEEGQAMNVVTKQTGPYFEVGVVDPLEVVLASVESAISIASILLTSSGIIVETQKKPRHVEDQEN